MVFVHLPATIYASIILQTYLKRPPLFHKKLTNQLTAISHLFTCVDLLCLVTFLTRHPTTPNELAFTVLCDSSQLCPIPMPTTHNITRPFASSTAAIIVIVIIFSRLFFPRFYFAPPSRNRMAVRR